MSIFNKLRMGVASAGFGAAILHLPIVTQAKEKNIPMRPILGMTRSTMTQLIFLALILMFTEIIIWLPTYFYGQ